MTFTKQGFLSQIKLRFSFTEYDLAISYPSPWIGSFFVSIFIIILVVWASTPWRFDFDFVELIIDLNATLLKVIILYFTYLMVVSNTTNSVVLDCAPYALKYSLRRKEMPWMSLSFPSFWLAMSCPFNLHLFPPFFLGGYNAKQDIHFISENSNFLFILFFVHSLLLFSIVERKESE